MFVLAAAGNSHISNAADIDRILTNRRRR